MCCNGGRPRFGGLEFNAFSLKRTVDVGESGSGYAPVMHEPRTKQAIPLAVTALLSAVACSALGCAGAQETSLPETSPVANESQELVVPFWLSYQNWDYHLAQWLPESSPYEMAELMLDDLDQAEPVAWFFLTERAAPKRQTHFVNKGALAPFLARGLGDRDWPHGNHLCPRFGGAVRARPPRRHLGHVQP